ncbi:subtilisin-like serine protease [Apiospora phragmitis]|uniref:Subtilisin-like serine protease n=1 Tax=Apiospora phragmitis TaxID=2905665 RepID=A0ABR1VZC7_9PEZI
MSVSICSLLWAALPFLSFIHSSLQAGGGTVRVDDEHRGTTQTAEGKPLFAAQSEHIAVEGAYLIAFKGNYKYDDGFLTKLSGKLGIQASLRVDLTGEVFNGISIQISRDGYVDDVLAVSPMREHPKPEPLPAILHGDDPALLSRASSGLFKRQHVGQNNSQTEHLMAQVDQAHAAGYTGKGQKIAIIDAWIDYTHPALGGCLVSSSREWLEDDDKASPDPECKSHATALASVIAAQNGGSSFSGYGGVAPGVELGSYAIAGCAHGGNDEKLIQALDQALQDGVTAVVYSMGSIDGWADFALNLAFDAASRRGLLIVVAAGSHGAGGVFKTSRPAEAAEALGVGAVDNTHSYTLSNVSTYNTQSSGGDGEGEAVEFACRDGEPGPGAAGWNDIVPPLWFDLNMDDHSDHCSKLFPDDVPDLSNRLVLLPRPRNYCSDIELADRAAEKGARYVMMVDHDADQRIEIVRVNAPALRAIALTNKQQGDDWLRLLQSGATVTVNMAAPPDRVRALVDKKECGSRMSDFTAWGPTYDGYMPTSVSAPGNDILTTRADGGWLVTGGTSLSGPFVAAVAALVAEARGTQDWRVLRSLLSTTAAPLVRAAPQDLWDQPGLERASTAQQGGGLVQAMKAIRAPCEIGVHKILFNDTAHRQKAVFTIRNPTPDAITYDLGNIPAGTVYPFRPGTWRLGNYGALTNDGLYTPDFAASLSYPKTGARVTVPGNGGQATVEVAAADPPGVNKTRLPIFSGWLALNGSDGFDYTIPYMGLAAGSLDATPTMHTLAWQRRGDDSTIEPGGTVTLPDEAVNLAFELALMPRRVVTELRDAATGATLGDPPMSFGLMAYANGGRWGWGGDFSNGSRVPAGEFVVVAKSQAAFMSGEDRSEWQQATSPPVKIKWTR